MLNNMKLVFIILSAVSLMVSGCIVNEPEEVRVTPDLPGAWQSDNFAQRFMEATPQSPTVVESAIELSEKYANLSEEATLLKQQNQSLTAKNQQLREQLDTIEEKLRQTQSELSQANEAIFQINNELTNWKADVLGFRAEMRNAQTAQLQALFKILKVLGGESMIETTQSNAIGQAVATAK